MKLIRTANRSSKKVAPSLVSVIEWGSGLHLMQYELWNLFSTGGNGNGKDGDMNQAANLVLQHLMSRGFSVQLLNTPNNRRCIGTICRGDDRVWENHQALAINRITYPELWNDLPPEVCIALFELMMKGLRIPRERLNGSWLKQRV